MSTPCKFFEWVPIELFQEHILPYVPILNRAIVLVRVCKDFHRAVLSVNSETLWQRMITCDFEMRDLLDLEQEDWKFYKLDHLMKASLVKKNNENAFLNYLKRIYLLGDDISVLDSPWKKLNDAGKDGKISIVNLVIPFYRMNLNYYLVEEIQTGIETAILSKCQNVTFNLRFDIYFCNWTRTNAKEPPIPRTFQKKEVVIYLPNGSMVDIFSGSNTGTYIETVKRKDLESEQTILSYTNKLSRVLEIKPCMIQVGHYLKSYVFKDDSVEWFWTKNVIDRNVMLVNASLDGCNNTIVTILLDTVLKKADFTSAKTGDRFVHAYSTFLKNTQLHRERLEFLFDTIRKSSKRDQELYLLLNQPRWGERSNSYSTAVSLIQQLDNITMTKFKFFSLHIKSVYKKYVHNDGLTLYNWQTLLHELVDQQ